MKTILVTLMLALFGLSNANAQVGIGTTNPDASALLDIDATDKGFLPPRMTENDKTTIANPIPPGLQIFCTDCGCSGEMQVYDGTEWLTMAGSGVAPDAPTITSATNATGPGTVDIAFTAPANDGGKAIISYTATSFPDGITGTVSQAGDGTITVSGLDCETAYTFTVTATNCAGTSVASAPDTVTTDLDVGCFKAGGVVFYIASPAEDLNGDGIADTGLVVGLNDFNSVPNHPWSPTPYQLIGATATAIGEGQTNTTAILGTYGAGTSYAAGVCDNYSFTLSGTTYNDWFLPSIDELNEINTNKAVINATSTANDGDDLEDGFSYWSSTELNANEARTRYMREDPTFLDFNKGGTRMVRPIRAF